jgi:hypothetical protein
MLLAVPAAVRRLETFCESLGLEISAASDSDIKIAKEIPVV